MVAQDVIEAMDKASTELAAKAKETVSWLAKEKDIPLLDHIERREGATVSFARVSGPVFQVLQNESLLTDLVVYAHMGAPLNNQLKSVQADLLIGCRRPFLIAPEEAPRSSSASTDRRSPLPPFVRRAVSSTSPMKLKSS